MKSAKSKLVARGTTTSTTQFEFDETLDEVVDPGIVTRESVTVCPFGEGLVCTKPGCMVCDEGPRCCSPGETCYLSGQDTTNWCTGFRGGVTDGVAPPMAAATAAAAVQEPRSFWER
jgi:hypothetical protein